MPDATETNTAPPPQERGLFDLPDFGAMARAFATWCRQHPLPLALLIAVLGLLGYFYFGFKAFQSLSITPARWLAAGWNSENDQQHCVVVLPIAVFLVLLRWRDLGAARKEPSNAGLWWIGAGVLAMVASVRCVEGRYAVLALTLLGIGFAQFCFGREVARIVSFPCAFLLFMMPLGGLVQGTADLQSQTARVIQILCGIFGIPIRTNGATLISADGKFSDLEVAGGCSGIRSLMAMMMLAALYAYFSMRTKPRGFLLFACSIVFALIGNFFRVFSVVLVARFVGSHAAHVYHDYSGLVFFPVAVLAMVGVGNVLNRDWQWFSTMKPNVPAAPPGSAAEQPSSDPPSSEPPKSQTATYDY